MTVCSIGKRTPPVWAENIADDKIAESVPLADRHARHLLGKLEGAAA